MLFRGCKSLLMTNTKIVSTATLTDSGRSFIILMERASSIFLSKTDGITVKTDSYYYYLIFLKIFCICNRVYIISLCGSN